MLFSQMNFQRTIGTPDFDECEGMVVTSDGGFAVTGHIHASALSNLFLTKFDQNGVFQWSKVLEVPIFTYASDIKLDHDGNFVFLGYTNDFNSKSIILYKTDSLGNLIWSKIYENANQVLAGSICIQNDGYIVCGSITNSSAFVLKTDTSGNLIWSHGWIEGIFTILNNCNTTYDGGIIACGFYKPNTSINIPIVAKYDQFGNTEWEKIIDIGTSAYAGSIKQTTDSGYIMCSSEENYDSLDYATLTRLNSDGSLRWKKNYYSTLINKVSELNLNSDGSILLSGGRLTIRSVADTYIYFIMKTDSLGNVIWANSYGDDSLWSNIASVQPSASNGYFVAGSAYVSPTLKSEIYIMHIDDNGSSGCNQNAVPIFEDFSTATISSGLSSTSSFSVSNFPFTSTQLNFTDQIICSTIGIGEQNFYKSKIYPVPTQQSLTIDFGIKSFSNIEIQIIDNLGRVLRTEKHSNSNESFEIDVSNLTTGIYFVTLWNGHLAKSAYRFVKIE